MRISRVIFICCFLLPFLASCTRDEIEDNSYPLSEYDGTGVLFRLKAESFDDTGSATRTVDLTAPSILFVPIFSKRVKLTSTVKLNSPILQQLWWKDSKPAPTAFSY